VRRKIGWKQALSLTKRPGRALSVLIESEPKL
jgi:hypothetical protein